MKDLNCIKDPKIRESFYRRFEKYVVKKTNSEDCWEWKGAKSTHGYPVLSMGKKLKVFRVSRLLLNDIVSMPIDKTNVLHTCDNPECTNPNHLFWGSQKENMQDCKSKKRNYKPLIMTRDITPRCLIKNSDLKDISELSKIKNCKEISIIYGVNEETVRRFLKTNGLKAIDKRLSKNRKI